MHDQAQRDELNHEINHPLFLFDLSLSMHAKHRT
jgi:hypothetical protein